MSRCLVWWQVRFVICLMVSLLYRNKENILIQTQNKVFLVVSKNGSTETCWSMEAYCLMLVISTWRFNFWNTLFDLKACKSGAILHDKEQEYGDICAQFGHHLILAQEVSCQLLVKIIKCYFYDQARSDIERISQIQSLKDVDISNTQFFSELCSLPSAVAAESNGGKKWLNNFLLQNKTHTYSLQRDQVRIL